METGVGPFFRMKALLWSSVDGNEWEAIGEDLNSLWTGASSWSCWLADVSLSFHNITDSLQSARSSGCLRVTVHGSGAVCSSSCGTVII